MSVLSHLKVLDLSRILAGPWASQLLADMGAEVIKIEKPNGGDDTRHWGPPYLKDNNGNDTNESAYFLCSNRGKKSVCVDIRTQEGQAVIRSLASQCDVLIENFKVGDLAKYNLDYQSLNVLNPKLVYCSITGFGQTGPYKDRLGYDFLIQAMGGLMSVTGEPDENNGQPQKVGVALTDIMTGLYASNGVLAALAEREHSGLGQYIDLSLFDVTAATLANQASNYLVGGDVPGRLGNAHPNIAPYQSFDTADNFIVIAVGNDSQFENLANALNKADLAANSRFKRNAERVHNRVELIELIQPILLQHNSDYWLNRFDTYNVPAGPINNIDQVMNDPQIIAREMQVSFEQIDNDDIKVVGNPIKFSRTPNEYKSAPPKLGEHTQSVLESLKLDVNRMQGD